MLKTSDLRIALMEKMGYTRAEAVRICDIVEDWMDVDDD